MTSFVRSPALVGVLVAALVGVAGLIAAPAVNARQAAGGGAPPSVPAAVKTGPQVFGDSCASCHGRDLKGTDKAKSLFTSEVLAKGDAALKTAIADHATPAGSPAFKDTISENQIHQLVVYLRIQGANQKGKPTFVANPDGLVIKSEKQTVKVEVVATGLETPWGMSFLPDGRLLVTERPGRLRIVDKSGKLLPEPVKGTPKVWERQDSGMLDVAAHPNYRTNGWIYLSYTDLAPGAVAPAPSVPAASPAGTGAAAPRAPSPPSMTVVIRGKLNARNEWVDTQEVFRAPAELYTPSGSHYGSRFVFDKAGHVFYSIGERGDPANAQRLDTPLGKVHRINDDGSVPSDNPFVNTSGAIKTIWSYGHRNPEGLTFDPVTGLMWESEHGPTGGDEINIIEKGHNYGWGVATMGIQPGITKTHQDGMHDPIVWYPWTMGPSSIGFYAGSKYPGWKNNLFVSGMAGQQLRRFEVSGRSVTHQEPIFENLGRVRATITGPDGLFYVALQDPTGSAVGLPLSASTPGRVIRLVPVK